jgi:hypothetical protein
VRADLELLAGLLVDVGATQNGVPTDVGGQRHGAGDASTGALRRLDDVRGGAIEELVIERLEADADFGGIGHG